MWIHIPTPRNNYSSAYGSARITATYEISCQHQIHGGDSRIIVGHGTRHDYEVGNCIEVEFGPKVSRQQKLVDVTTGHLGLPRYFGERLYRPVLKAIPIDFDGPIFVHNNPVAIPLLARERPKAKICLWVANELFNTYTTRETRRVVRAAYRVLCVSKYIAEDVRSHLGYDDSKIRVVHNGVNLDSFQPTQSRSPKSPLILFVGRVVSVKGVDLLIEASHLLAQKNLDFRVKIIGSNHFDPREHLTAYEKNLRNLASPISDRVTFVPAMSRAAIAKEYQSADIFCSPIRWKEPFGLTFLEAMASGLPVVTAPLGAAQAICSDVAHYFEPENVRSLADQLELLLCDSKLRRATGEKARQHASNHSWHHSYQQLLAALN